jgi:hypothetical protein
VRSDLYSFVELSFGVLEPGNRFIPAAYLELLCAALKRVGARKCMSSYRASCIAASRHRSDALAERVSIEGSKMWWLWVVVSLV